MTIDHMDIHFNMDKLIVDTSIDKITLAWDIGHG